MHVQELRLGFSTADTSYPSLVFAPARLSASFRSSSGEPVAVEFGGVAAFSWQEDQDDLLPGEPWDGPCEIFDSPLLAAHPPGKTMYSVAGLRHIRFHFNEWGRLDVLCTSFSKST
ncbi:MAG: hypothetical protein MUC36_14420 [Planctomycetes bacterium]|jgi:hypothetical protein|nr:hypothetical protein [Planctomycetota bacterium]